MGYLEMKRNALLNDFVWYAGVEAIAAYQFKGVASRSKAAKDLTGHGYNLKSSVSSKRYRKTTWNTDNGFGFPSTSYMENADLNARKDIKTIIIRYSNATVGTMLTMTSPKVDNPIIYLGTGLTYPYPVGEDSNHILVIKNATVTEYTENNFRWSINLPQSKSAVQQEGVVAYSTDGNLYFNGVLQQTTSYKSAVEINRWGTQAGTLISTYQMGASTLYVQAAAFYNTVLDASTIADYSNQMAEI